MSTPVSQSRPRALLEFFVAILYFFFARALAHMGAQGLVADQWNPLVEQTMLAFLLVIGYAAMGFWLDREMHPISAQGFPRREGFVREFGTGLATGWGLALVCVLFMALGGGIAVAFSWKLQAWGWFVVDAAFFAMVALAEEIAFRGYGFQRFEKAFGPLGASLALAAYYAFVQRMIFGTAGRAAVAASIALALVLSVAYLRTRALWLSWGLNFGWKASRALVFGVAVSGDSTHSPVVQGDPMGPFWLTGGGFGLDGAWITFFVLLALLPVVFRITRELNFRYNAPILVPGGIPVDIDAASRAQHEAAMGPVQNTAPTLVQIASTPGSGVSAGAHSQESSQNPN